METAARVHGFEDQLMAWVEYAALGIEILAVAIIISAIVFATARFLLRLARQRLEMQPRTYEAYKRTVARTLLLSLEIMVAADIVRTVTLDPSPENFLGLGLLVLIRTFLSWSLVVEIEGRWPWAKNTGRTKKTDKDAIETAK